MKTLVMALCLAISLLSGVAVEAEKSQFSRNWSWGDPLLPVLAAIMFWMFLAKHWKINLTAMLFGLVAVSLAFSGVVNGQLTAGTFLNLSRTAAAAFLVNVATYNCIQNPKDLRRFAGLAALSAAPIYLFAVPRMIQGWSGGFTNIWAQLDYLDLNAMGFGFVLLYCATSPQWFAAASFVKGTPVAGLVALGALISFSRSAFSTLALCSVMIAVFGNKSNSGRAGRFLTLLAALLACGFITQQVLKQVDGASQFVANKADGYVDDAVGLRVDELTIRPISEWAGQGPSVIIFGDAVSVQHTLIANALCFSGIFGLGAQMLLFLHMTFRAWTGMRSSPTPLQRVAATAYLAMIISMFIDDSVANTRSHSMFIACLFATTVGAFEGSLRFVGARAVPHATIVSGYPRNAFPLRSADSAL